MSESHKIELSSKPEYTINSVPCKIRFTGPHHSIPDHFHKSDDEKHIVTYLRGRKLHGEELRLKGLKGYILDKEYDQVKSIGSVQKTLWFEREGHELEINEKINEGITLSELIHG